MFNNARYEDYGSPARDFDELMALLLMERAERAERAEIARHPAILVSQKSACAYVVYATSWGRGQKGFTVGYV